MWKCILFASRCSTQKKSNSLQPISYQSRRSTATSTTPRWSLPLRRCCPFTLQPVWRPINIVGPLCLDSATSERKTMAPFEVPPSLHSSIRYSGQCAIVIPKIVLIPPNTPPPEPVLKGETLGGVADDRLELKPVVLHDGKAVPDASEWKPDSSDGSAATEEIRHQRPEPGHSVASTFLAQFLRFPTDLGQACLKARLKRPRAAQRSVQSGATSC